MLNKKGQKKKRQAKDDLCSKTRGRLENINKISTGKIMTWETFRKNKLSSKSNNQSLKKCYLHHYHIEVNIFSLHKFSEERTAEKIIRKRLLKSTSMLSIKHYLNCSDDPSYFSHGSLMLLPRQQGKFLPLSTFGALCYYRCNLSREWKRQK